MNSGLLRCGSIRQSCIHETSSKIPFPSLSLCFIGFNWEFRQWPRYHFFPDILVITSTVWYVLSEHSQHRGHQPPAEFTSPDLKLIYICVCVPACWWHTEFYPFNICFSILNSSAWYLKLPQLLLHGSTQLRWQVRRNYSSCDGEKDKM